MATTKTATKAITTTPVNASIHGEIVSWDLDGMRVRYSHLQEALRDSGLEPKLARAMLPRNAFARASKKLAESRIIRKVSEDENTLKFQLTQEVNEGDRLRYDYETVIGLDKETGDITSDSDALTAKAKSLFDDEVEHRRTSDITALLQRLFRDKNRNNLDLIPINKRGTYLVRREYIGYVEQVESFLARLNARLTRMPIAAGTPAGDRCVKEAIGDRMKAYVAELDEAIDGFGQDTSERSLKTAAERVRLLKHKIASYSDYLEDEKAAVDAALESVKIRLTAKIAGVTEAEASGEEPAGAGAQDNSDVGF